MPSLISHFFRYLIKKRSIANQTTRPDIDVARKALDDAGRQISFLPRSVKATHFKIGSMDAEWLTPARAGTERVLYYIHGGGYIRGSLDSHRAMMGRVGLAGNIRVLAINYRLAPENQFPAALEDVSEAYDWLVVQGIAPQNIIVGGDSAGGGLTLALMLTLREKGFPLPALGLLLSPWTDLAGTGDSITNRIGLDPMFPHFDWDFPKMYAGATDVKNPLVSPLYADLRGLPPLFIMVGDHEIILNDSTRLADRACAAGVSATLEIWPNMWHVWMFFAPWMPEANRAMRRVGQVIQSTWR